MKKEKDTAPERELIAGRTVAQVLAEEFHKDPEAYRETRAQALQPEVLYRQAREQVIAEQNAAIRAFLRKVVKKIRHPFS
ncbi:hypothetical protein [Streptomyces sp. NPDC060205]|uniref:hypothetical protein n=1 Tax=Streptomyces sp. NPDC060205 TaxID=3347072 RepID=UPI00364B9BA2